MIAQANFNFQGIDSWTEWAPRARLEEVESIKISVLVG
jgi:hypothetical protein